MSKKKNFKIISIVITLFVISTLVSLKGLITNATVASRPEFDIAFSPIPERARVGEDIVVKGTITPKPFEIPVPEKEIVFVVDIDALNNGKLTSLMSETKNFIAKIKSNDKFNNIKIATIAYGNEAEIKRENNVAFLDSKTQGDKIEGILSGLKNNGNKTNTGEAFRKALYLLTSKESVKDANKTIIFISDSAPTARTVYNKNSGQEGNFYTDITKDSYENATIDNSNDVNEHLKYAKEMAEMINNKGYNVFTIAYGLDKDNKGEPALREIHQTMSGNDLSNKNNDANNGFFIASDTSDAAKNVFLNIADRVLQNYSLNNIKMNLNFTGDFSLNTGKNIVNLSNINYELKSVSNGKARYEATPINFEFILKGKTEGERQQIFDKVTITYPWKEAIEKVDINSELFITINSNELPSILGNLTSDEVVNVSKGENFTVKYELYPEDFQFKDSNNSLVKDVVLVVDNSKYMDQNALNGTMNSIMNNLVDDLTLKNSNTQYSIVTLAQSNKVSLELTSDRSIIQPITSKIQSGGPQWDSQAELGSAFSEIYNIFQKGRAEASKNIIIVAQENVNYTDDQLKDFKEKVENNGYNVIALIVGQQSWDNNLNKMSKLVGANGLNIGSDNLFKSGSDNNSIANSIMSKIKDRLINSTLYRPYVFNPQITVDLLDNFEIRSDLEIVNGNIAKVISNKQIVYNYIGDNKYHAEPIYIEFTVRVKENKYGQLNFGNILLTHKSLYGNDKKILLKSPKVIMKSEIKDISHGLYNGINNGQVSIQENNNGKAFEIAQGSTVTFGADFTFSGSSTEFNLNVDNKFSVLNASDIKIYKVLKDSSGNSTLKELDATNKSILASGDNKFKVSIKNITDSSTEILVVYQGKVMEGTAAGQTLTNGIVFSSISKNATIITPQQSNNSPILPDLF